MSLCHVTQALEQKDQNPQEGRHRRGHEDTCSKEALSWSLPLQGVVSPSGGGQSIMMGKAQQQELEPTGCIISGEEKRGGCWEILGFLPLFFSPDFKPIEGCEFLLFFPFLYPQRKQLSEIPSFLFTCIGFYRYGLCRDP